MLSSLTYKDCDTNSLVIVFTATFKKNFFLIYLFRLGRVLVAAHGLLAVACLQDLVPRPGLEPGPPALGAWSLTHWTTGKSLYCCME